MMSESTHELSEKLEKLVISTRSQLRRNAVLVGIGIMLIAGIGGLSAGAVLDILVTFPVWLRISTGIILLVLVLTAFLLLVFWPAIRPMGLEHIAFLIESMVGRMHNSLVTVIDLRRRKKILDHRVQPLEDRLIKQTAERLVGYRVETVADPKPVRKVALATALTILTAVILSFLFYERISTAALRLIMPTKLIPPVTSVKLHAYPGDTSVLFGEPFRLWATTEGEEQENLTLQLRNDQGEISVYPMLREGTRQFAFTLGSVNASYDYQIIGGGTWTIPKRITVIHRPIIEKMSAEIHLPEYMKISEPLKISELTQQINAPTGSMIQVAAQVNGDTTEGEIHLFRADKQVTEQKDIVESVWFDDDVPVDAELMGKWRWTSEQMYSGSQAHTFNWSRQPYGFYTRLHPLNLGADESLFLYMRLDTEDQPKGLKIRLLTAAVIFELIFDSSAASLAQEEKERLRLPVKKENPDNWFSDLPAPTVEVREMYAGPLPALGRWERIELPATVFTGENSAGPMKVEGLQFRIEKGTILFDRVGACKPVIRKLEKTHLEPIETIPMQYDALHRQWTGTIPAAESHFTLEFRNQLGYTNAARQAIPIVPTDDQQPTVLIERPGKNLALASPQAIPLVIRACDDFGVADVFLQTATNPDQFGEPQELSRYEQPEVNCKVITSLDTKAVPIEPGQPIYYRIFAQDYKGQVGTSEIFQISLDTASGQTGVTDPANEALAGILENIQSMMDIRGQLAAGAVENIITLPEGFEVNLDVSGTVTLLNPDGTVMTAEDMKRMLRTWNEGMTDEQQRKLSEMYGQIQRERQELLYLSERLFQAADQENSMLMLPAEAEALRAMAMRAQQISSMYPVGDNEVLSEDVLKRLESLQELTPDQKRELTQLQRQLQEIMVARQTLADSPTQSQNSLSNLMAELQARQAMEQLQGLNTFLESQKDQLEKLRIQVIDLQQSAKDVPAQQMDDISSQQQELDPEALELISKVEELLKKQQKKMLESQETMPPAPWIPPGREVDAMPIEADTPEENPEPSSEGNMVAMKNQLKEMLEQEELDWWDQPVNMPTDAQRRDVDARFVNRDTRPTSSAARVYTPRQLLMEHQDQMQQSLTANSNDLSSVQNQLARTIGQLDQFMSKEAAPQMSGLMNILGSSDVRQAMDMSSWVVRNFQMNGDFWPGSSMTMRNQMSNISVRPGRAITIGYDYEDSAPVEGATMYRLPTRVRQPLIQGMQERGPEAYQPLIEAYYRDLSAELEK